VHATAAAGLGFLLSVLWFDLMFDVQARGVAGDLSPDVRNSIAGYYRRVTTAARPMNRLIAAVMVVTLAAIVGELVTDAIPAVVAWVTLVLAATGIGLAAARTVRNAVRLGEQTVDPAGQSALARSILRDHVVCLGAIGTALVIQLIA
jgi:hypothetical protein